MKLLNFGSVGVVGYLDFVKLLLFQTKNKVMEWICFHHLGHVVIYFQSVIVTNTDRDLSTREQK